MCDLRASLVSWRGSLPSSFPPAHLEVRTDLSLGRYGVGYSRPCSFQLRYTFRQTVLSAPVVYPKLVDCQGGKWSRIIRCSRDVAGADSDPNEATLDQLQIVKERTDEGFRNPNNGHETRVQGDESIEADSSMKNQNFQDLEEQISLQRVKNTNASPAERIDKDGVAKQNGNSRVTSGGKALSENNGFNVAMNESPARSDNLADVQRLATAQDGTGATRSDDVAPVQRLATAQDGLGATVLNTTNSRDNFCEIESPQISNIQVTENSIGSASTKRQAFRANSLIDFASKQMSNVSLFFMRLLPWEQRKRLEHLHSDADGNPKDASKQAALLKELFKQSPQAVIERFERREHAVNEEAVVEYIKALVVTDAIADFLPDHQTGRSSGLPALLLELKRAAGDLEEPLVPPGMTEQKPLHVVMVDSKISNKSTRLVQELLYALFFMIVFSILWVMGTAALRKYVNGTAGLGPSSSIGAGSVYSPKEFSKEVVPEKNSKTFKDVKGCDEAKEELEEIVEYLRNPTKFTRLGGKLPKGVLLIGPPGTGKTLLAKAIAGEAAVPFFYRAGSEFEEMFVGVGARRVRSLFQAAKKKAPCIVFIDEIDAVGSSRKHWEGHTKKTLNQLLVEMDGFEANEGIIVLAATNLPESLDPALIRPGRFDRHVVVTNPDIRGRQEILELYMKDKPLSEDVDVKSIARGTPGLTGADLANLVNMAAVKAAIDGVDKITSSQFEFAKDKLLMGTERKSMVLSEESRKLTAYHESGHAVVAFNTAGANPIHKATIMPRGTALGMVTQLPEKDETSVSKLQLMARLDVCMGGRAAEELVFGSNQITSGARSDLQQATALARHMVSECGMSEMVGPVFIDAENQRSSPDIQKSIDTEVVRLLKEAYERARYLLKKHEADLHNLANALLEHETLNADELKEILQPIHQAEETLVITDVDYAH